jgi:hypothetical protein
MQICDYGLAEDSENSSHLEESSLGPFFRAPFVQSGTPVALPSVPKLRGFSPHPGPSSPVYGRNPIRTTTWVPIVEHKSARYGPLPLFSVCVCPYIARKSGGSCPSLLLASSAIERARVAPSSEATWILSPLMKKRKRKLSPVHP